VDEKERNRRVIDITYNSAPSSFNVAWGWRIPQNPERAPGKWTDAELEVTRMAQANTPQEREIFRTKTYAYWAPFNYPNVEVELGRPGTGVEFNPDGAEIDIYPYGAITIEEDEPILAVTVIGSGCANQAYLYLEAEPLEWKYPRTAVRMHKSGLWGCHLRGDAWFAGMTEFWNDAGLSSARFDLPPCKRVILGGGGLGADPHHCFRIIRVEVQDGQG